MKNTILNVTFILLSFISNAQVITIVIDSVQNYTRPIGRDVFESRDFKEITYTSFGDLSGDDMVLTYDLDSKNYTVDGSMKTITKVNKTKMAFDLELLEDGYTCFAKLALTEDHKFVYVFEYENNGIMDGFFWVGREVYCDK